MNFQGGVQGAATGAQTGAMFGPWGAAIGAVAGAAIGLFSKDQEKEAVKKYNNQVVQNFATQLFDVRRVQNANNMAYSQALASYQDANRVTQAKYNAQFGAADIIGSSAKALSQTMDFQTQQAAAQTTLNWEATLENTNSSINQMANQAVGSLQRKKGGQQQQASFADLTKMGLNMYRQFQGGGSNTSTGSFQSLSASLGGVNPTGASASTAASSYSNVGGLGSMFGLL